MYVREEARFSGYRSVYVREKESERQRESAMENVY